MAVQTRTCHHCGQTRKDRETSRVESDEGRVYFCKGSLSVACNVARDLFEDAQIAERNGQPKVAAVHRHILNAIRGSMPQAVMA